MVDNTTGEFAAPEIPEGEDADFYTDSPKGVLREETSSGSVSGDRATEAPEDKIQEHRDITYTDPHVNEAVMTLLDWVLGDGYSLAMESDRRPTEEGGDSDTGGSPEPAGGDQGDGSQPDLDITGDGDSQQGEGNLTLTQKIRRLLRRSNFWTVVEDWVRTAMVDGHAFMELVVEEGSFEPKLLPTKEMERKEDKFGQLQFYKLKTPSGASAGGSGGAGGNNEVKYEPHEVAELYFRKDPKEDFGRSLIEPIAEQADMLRDMEIDYARFVATKAYPPILWKLGDEDHNWTENQVETWMDNVAAIEPDTMLAAPHDVETDVVGTTSTTSTAGAMRLEETFKHFENRVSTGLGVPRILMNMDSDGQGEATATMPSFKRRVTRLQSRVQGAITSGVVMSLLAGGEEREAYQGPVPNFEFDEHSTSEKRLEMDKLLKLFNNGLLTPTAFAERAGMDPQEIPEFWDSGNLIENLRALSSTGDDIQNPAGGRPTDTEGGTESAGGEVTSREGGSGSDSSDGRNEEAVTAD
jgi:hypothetical protein